MGDFKKPCSQCSDGRIVVVSPLANVLVEIECPHCHGTHEELTPEGKAIVELVNVYGVT